ncbi:MAG: hypothetical protein Q7K39_03790, partial [Candidatus Magasanikbacteria bacterium]|nr:hypothetical protein [Candidatus Magasanikbacteria bacterium]
RGIAGGKQSNVSENNTLAGLCRGVFDAIVVFAVDGGYCGVQQADFIDCDSRYRVSIVAG